MGMGGLGGGPGKGGLRAWRSPMVVSVTGAGCSRFLQVLQRGQIPFGGGISRFSIGRESGIGNRESGIGNRESGRFPIRPGTGNRGPAGGGTPRIPWSDSGGRAIARLMCATGDRGTGGEAGHPRHQALCSFEGAEILRARLSLAPLSACPLQLPVHFQYTTGFLNCNPIRFNFSTQFQYD